MADEIALSYEEDRKIVLENTIKAEAKNHPYSSYRAQKISALKRHFVETVIEYAGGCMSAKSRFLSDCDLDDYLPNIDYEVKVTFSIPYGDSVDDDHVENAFHDAVYAIDGSSPYVDIYESNINF